MGKLIKKPVSLFIDKTWTEIGKEVVAYLQRWAYTYPKGFEEIAELFREQVETKISDSHIFDNDGRINILYIYIRGYEPGPIAFNIEMRDLRNIAKMFKNEKEKP